MHEKKCIVKVVFVILALFLTTAVVFATGSQPSGEIATISIMKYADDTDYGPDADFPSPSPMLIASFMKQHPNIKVEEIYINQSYTSTYTIKFAAGEAPDVAWIGGAFWQFVDKGAFLDISDKIKSDKAFDLEDTFPGVMALYNYKGVQYAVPNLCTTDVIGYNKAMFDKAGLPYPEDDWTLEEMVEMAKKLTRDINGDGVNDEWGIADWGNNANTAVSYGGLFINKEGTKITLDNPTSREVAQIWYDMIFKDKCHPHPQESQTLFGAGSGRSFRSGKVAISKMATWIRGPFRTIEDFDWDGAALPTYNGKVGNWMGGEAYLISSQTKYPDAAYELAKFTCSKEWITTQTGSGSSMPALKSLANSDFFLEPDKKPKNAKVWLQTIETGFLTWPHPASPELNRAFRAISDRLVLPAGDKDKLDNISEALKLMVKDCQKVLDDYNAGE